MQNIIKDEIPDVYVHRIMIGPNIVIDTVSGFFKDTNEQVGVSSGYLYIINNYLHHTINSIVSKVTEVCAALAADPELQGGYNAIGFSQVRYYLVAEL